MSPLISGINLSERNAQTLHIRAESARLALLAALFFWVRPFPLSIL